jgi:hypothetical protein
MSGRALMVRDLTIVDWRRASVQIPIPTTIAAVAKIAANLISSGARFS